MSYEQTLHYLYHKLPLYSNIGKRAYKADLGNTVALCGFLNNPERRIKTVHVAGTNGKGSTSHMLAAIFQQAGYKTGLYTSPHLNDFRERIKVNGEMIAQEMVVDFVERVQTFSETIQPSFFELTFVMALDYFASQETDIAIIETGLGGRLDSTNVIVPEVSVITNIAFDHMDILGDSLSKIAFEKAGIIKPKVPVIIGEILPETHDVFEKKALECDAPIYFAEKRYAILATEYDNEKLTLYVLEQDKKLTRSFTLDLNGLYQQKNLPGVLCAVDVLRKVFIIRDGDLHAALRNVKKLTGLRGRWEVIQQKPTVVLDVAHNEDGMKQLLLQINSIYHEKLHIVFGMVKDKDVEKVLAVLPVSAEYYFTKAHIPRALPERKLQERASKFYLGGQVYREVNAALNAAKENAGENDLIVVCGSIFIVGEIETRV